jgi:hypothetical protein
VTGFASIIAISAAAALASMQVDRSVSVTWASVELQAQSRAGQADSSRADSSGTPAVQSARSDSIPPQIPAREPLFRDDFDAGRSNIKTVIYFVGIALVLAGFLAIPAIVSYRRRKVETESLPLILPGRSPDYRPIVQPFPAQPDPHVLPEASPVEMNRSEESGAVGMPKPVEGTLQLLPGRFEIVSGTDRMKEIRFVKLPGQADVTFGRDAGAGHAHIQVDNPTVSRKHASMRFEAGRWHIRNLSETNPVVVNGEPLPNANEKLLNDSDQVEMGDVVFRFRSR